MCQLHITFILMSLRNSKATTPIVEWRFVVLLKSGDFDVRFIAETGH